MPHVGLDVRLEAAFHARRRRRRAASLRRHRFRRRMDVRLALRRFKTFRRVRHPRTFANKHRNKRGQKRCFPPRKRFLQISARRATAKFPSPTSPTTAKIFAAGAFNADGIITELSCDDVLKPVFADILSVSTPKTDRSGKDGIDAADVEKFFADAAAYTAWARRRQRRFGGFAAWGIDGGRLRRVFRREGKNRRLFREG